MNSYPFSRDDLISFAKAKGYKYLAISFIDRKLKFCSFYSRHALFKGKRHWCFSSEALDLYMKEVAKQNLFRFKAKEIKPMLL